MAGEAGKASGELFSLYDCMGLATKSHSRQRLLCDRKKSHMHAVSIAGVHG